MDAPKAKPYPDSVPDSLEKGCPETGFLDACHACSAQPAQTHGRRPMVKHPWVVFSTVAALTWLMFSCGRRAFGRPYQAWHWAGSNAEFPLSSTDGALDQCIDSANWTVYYDQPPWAPEYPHGAETAFSLPLDSNALYLTSRGAFQQGQVKIEQSTEIADTVDVRVRVAYYLDHLFELATICRTERADKEHGVGIFTPKWGPHLPRHWHPEYQLRFDVTVVLPAGNDGPLSVKKLETEMPNYSQTVADLQESVLFDSISLSSANGGLSVQSITSEVGQFSSLNGHIEGYFNVQSSLTLHTANGGIAPTVNVLHREGEDPSDLSIYTTNGQIDAEVSLTSEASVGGEFEVDAKSSNGKVGLKFSRTPVDSVLRCRAETVVGAVEVELDSAFEGAYSLQNVLGKKTVLQHEVEDPAGKGRHRVISQNEAVGRPLEGEVKWVDSDGNTSENKGYVVLKATVSSVKLVV